MGGPSSCTAQAPPAAQHAQQAQLGEAYGPEVLGRKIKLYWREQRTHYVGVITSFSEG